MALRQYGNRATYLSRRNNFQKVVFKRRERKTRFISLLRRYAETSGLLKKGNMSKQEDLEKGWEEYKEKKKQEILETAKEVYLNSHYSKVMSYEIARYIVKNNYRKVKKDEVVLTGTETTENLIDLLVDFDEMGFLPTELTPKPEEYAREWKRKLIYVIGHLDK